MPNLALKAQIVRCYGTAADFAEAIGVDQTFVSMIIRRRRELRDEEKTRWAKALKVKVKDIFS